MNKHFFKFGPTRVSATNFTVFCEDKDKVFRNFHKAFRYWTNESNDPELRYCCLWNLLGQPDSVGSGSWDELRAKYGICHLTDGNLGSFFRISGKEHVLYWTLVERPTLLEEFLEVFLFRLQADMVPNVSSPDMSTNYKIKLIELLLGIVRDEATQRTLWSYHPVSSVRTSLTADDEADYFSRVKRDDDYWYLYQLWPRQEKLPTWLQDELWQKVEEGVKADLACWSTASRGVSRLFDELGTTIRIYNSVAFRGVRDYVDQPKLPPDDQMELFVRCLQLLENVLPSGAAYCKPANMIELAMSLTDEQLAFKFARRHVLRLLGKDLNPIKKPKGRWFLRWLHSLSFEYTPDDVELLNIIAKLLRSPGVSEVGNE